MTNHLIQLRKELHRAPELSGNEKSTASLIVRELKKCNPDEILEEVGGTGVAAVFRANKEKAEKAILFRAELDAIAVQEETRLPYQSKYNGIMHGCGHDGHMAILVGLGYYLKENPPESKDVVLLFQPAEETGEGAERVLADKRFQKKRSNRRLRFTTFPDLKRGW
jgi:amidohydrolase